MAPVPRDCERSTPPPLGLQLLRCGFGVWGICLAPTTFRGSCWNSSLLQGTCFARLTLENGPHVRQAQNHCEPDRTALGFELDGFRSPANLEAFINCARKTSHAPYEPLSYKPRALDPQPLKRTRKETPGFGRAAADIIAVFRRGG